MSIAQGGSDGAAAAAAAANYADKMLPEVLPDTGKKYVFWMSFGYLKDKGLNFQENKWKTSKDR